MKWGERDTLGDFVRVIRMFRPLVIYSRFSGTPADGHGHHQEAGYLTPLAYKAAADPNEFPEQLREGLRPWQAKKLYRGNFGNARPDPANPSRAGAGRDHRSGRRPQLRGDFVRGTQPAQDAGAGRHRAARADRVGADARRQRRAGRRARRNRSSTASTSTIPGLAKLAGLPDGTIRAELAAMDAAAKKALADYEPLDPRAHRSGACRWPARDARRACGAEVCWPARRDARADADFLLAFKERRVLRRARSRSLDVDVDPLASQETVVQGDIGRRARSHVPARRDRA